MRVALLGRSELSLKTGEAIIARGHTIVVVATGKPAPEYKVGLRELESAAKGWNSTFIPRVDSEVVAGCLAQSDIDVGVSINYPGILTSRAIDACRLGILNAHGGDLPRYRGNACQAWAIVQGESHVAVCVHRMVPDRVDEGDILGRRYFPLLPESKIGDVYRWMEEVIPEMFAETLSELERDSHFILERQSEDPQDALRCFPRRPEDGRISWNLKPIEIVRLVNASGPPYAGAYCEIDNRRVIVLTASIAQDLTPFLAVPGQVIALTKDSVTVACKEGAVEIQEAQLEDGTALRDHIKNIRTRLT